METPNPLILWLRPWARRIEPVGLYIRSTVDRILQMGAQINLKHVYCKTCRHYHAQGYLNTHK